MPLTFKHPTRVLAGLLLCASLSAPALAEDSRPGRLHVTGTGEISVAPDKATLKARLWEQTEFVDADTPEKLTPGDMQQARSDLEARVSQVILALEDMGMPSGQIDAGSLRIRQVQTHKRIHNGPNQRLVATRIERPMTITFHDLERVPEALDELTGQGVNQLQGVTYGLSDMAGAKRDALAKAIENARLEADVMAAGLGVDIGRVVKVTRHNSGAPGPRPLRGMSNTMMLEDAAPAPAAKAEYRAADTTIRAEANVVWELLD